MNIYEKIKKGIVLIILGNLLYLAYIYFSGNEISNFSDFSSGLLLGLSIGCNGSNDYLNFVDPILGISNFFDKTEVNYDFSVIDTPKELFELVKNKNTDGMARLVAGYCWNWNKKELNNTNYHDLKIDDFEISWNLGQGQTFVIDDSINEAGCIHSVQG